MLRMTSIGVRLSTAASGSKRISPNGREKATEKLKQRNVPSTREREGGPDVEEAPDRCCCPGGDLKEEGKRQRHSHFQARFLQTMYGPLTSRRSPVLRFRASGTCQGVGFLSLTEIRSAEPFRVCTPNWQYTSESFQLSVFCQMKSVHSV